MRPFSYSLGLELFKPGFFSTSYLFTSISYGVNKRLKIPIFGISKMTGSGIKTSKVPDPDLIPRIAAPSIPIFIAAVL
jgi:hypothetical protein